MRPRPQFFLISVIIGSFLCSQALSILIFTQWAKGNLVDLIYRSSDLHIVQDHVITAMNHFLLLSFLISGSSALIAAAVTLKFTHRIFGPLVSIVNMINQLRGGNFSARVDLRDHDQLGEIRDSLNALAATLAEGGTKR